MYYIDQSRRWVYFKSGIDLLDFTDLANALITWLRSKTLVLALLCNAQIETLAQQRL